MEALTITRDWADSARKRVFLMGWSRGGAWALQIASTQSCLMDGVWCFAGYPSQKDQWAQQTEARALMQLDIPVVVCQFQSDYFCNPMVYPHWYAQFALAEQAQEGRHLGKRNRGSCSSTFR